MLCITTALIDEAKPLVEAFGLKKDPSERDLVLYRSIDGNTNLIVSGTGKINASIATTYLITKYGKDIVLFNIGICGSNKREFNKGAVVIPNKIIDLETNIEYYPELFIRHKFHEGTLATSSKVQIESHVLPKSIDIIDMEASGIFQAASKFITLSRIFFIKIVSDYLEDAFLLKRHEISSLVKKNLNEILDFLKIYYTFLVEVHDLRKYNETVEIINDFLSKTPFTATMRHMLKKYLLHYKNTGKSINDLLEKYRNEISNCTSKLATKDLFNKIIHEITSS